MVNFSGLDSITLNPGSECPPLSEGKVRFYNMRFCPFAHRALLALAVKNIPTEIVNVNLKDKPDWFLARNPMGKVPTMEHNGKVIYESGVCIEYLDEVFPDSKQILPKDPAERAHQKMLSERLSKLISAFYGALRKDPTEEAFQQLHDAVQFCETLLHANFFGGVEAGWADYMIWPWVERLGALELTSGGKFKLEDFPTMGAYIHRMQTRSEVKACAKTPELFVKFYKSYLSGSGADYDIGIAK